MLLDSLMSAREQQSDRDGQGEGGEARGDVDDHWETGVRETMTLK